MRRLQRALQGSGNAGFGDMPEVAETEMVPEVQGMELPDDFMPEWGMPGMDVSQAESFMPEMEVPGWDRPESIFVESSNQADSIALFSEETAPTKIYVPKRHKKDSGKVILYFRLV